MSRLITALGLLAIAVYLIFFAPQLVFAGAAILVGVICYQEYSGLVAGHGIVRPGALGLVTGVLILFWPSKLPPADLVCALTVLVIAAFIAGLRRSELRELLPQVAAAVLGAFYAFAPWRFAVTLRRESIHLLFFALALNWAGDSTAYYVGRMIGRHKLAPVVSPKKTWEGAVAGAGGSILFGVLYLRYFLPRMPWWEVATIAVIANVAGQFGDLAESAMKRGAGVKDSGHILPGHGGLLDRLDSSMFALPVVYALYRGFELILT